MKCSPSAVKTSNGGSSRQGPVAAAGGNRTEAARTLGVGRNTLARKVAKGLGKSMARPLWILAPMLLACRPTVPPPEAAREVSPTEVVRPPPAAVVSVPSLPAAPTTSSPKAVGAPSAVSLDRYPWLADATCASPAVVNHLVDRFPSPEGFTRVDLPADSFAERTWPRQKSPYT